MGLVKRRVRVLTAAYLGLLNDLESSSDGAYFINMGDVLIRLLSCTMMYMVFHLLPANSILSEM